MKIKTILLMIITLTSVFLSIYVSTLYAGFVAPYIIGFATPIIVNTIYSFDISKYKDKNKSKK